MSHTNDADTPTLNELKAQILELAALFELKGPAANNDGPRSIIFGRGNYGMQLQAIIIVSHPHPVIYRDDEGTLKGELGVVATGPLMNSEWQALESLLMELQVQIGRVVELQNWERAPVKGESMLI